MAIGILFKKWWAAVAVILAVMLVVVVVVLAGVGFTSFAHPGYWECRHWKGMLTYNAQWEYERPTGYWSCIHLRGFWIPRD